MSDASQILAIDPEALTSIGAGIEEIAARLAAGRVNLWLFVPASDAVSSALSDFEVADAVAGDAIERECTVIASTLRHVIRDVTDADRFEVGG